MLKEMSMNEMVMVNGGANPVKDLLKDLAKEALVRTIDKIAHTPYEKTVTRQGKKYTVKYDGNPGW